MDTAGNDGEGRFWWVGPLFMVVLGIVLLPTLPIWIALMLVLWPVFLLVGLVVGLVAVIRKR